LDKNKNHNYRSGFTHTLNRRSSTDKTGLFNTGTFMESCAYETPTGTNEGQGWSNPGIYIILFCAHNIEKGKVVTYRVLKTSTKERKKSFLCTREEALHCKKVR
jgi:hypothetical protein